VPRIKLKNAELSKRLQIQADIRETENEAILEQINKVKSYFFDKMLKIDNFGY
jgi:hypothetical protein